MADTVTLVVNINFEGAEDGEAVPPTQVVAYDQNGQPIGQAIADGKSARLSLPSAQANRTVRLAFGPITNEKEPPTLAAMRSSGAYEKRLRLDPQNPRLELTLVDPIWRQWILCSCIVRGRLVKRILLPDGTVRELPICHARVTICEVFRLPILLQRLPDHVTLRLRDDLLDRLLEPIRFPIPRPKPGPDPAPDVLTQFSGVSIRTDNGQLRFGDGVNGNRPALGSIGVTPELGQAGSVAATAMMEEMPGMAMEMRGTSLRAMESSDVRAASSNFAATDTLRMLASATTATQIRESLVTLQPDLIRILCLLDYLEPYFTILNCVRTVNVDEEGRFATTLRYPCLYGGLNLYFKAQQHQGFFWRTIYAPTVRCHTHWNYPCGSEVVINVTDPAVIPCAPSDPVTPPPGITTWVMPFKVGDTPIWGTPPGSPAAPGHWVRTDGLTNYGGLSDAPFGSTLGFRLGFSNTIPGAAGITYYRWSYRKVGAADWARMDIPVIRHYVKQRPGGVLPSFPVFPLGPHTVGSSDALFFFKPLAPPPPDPADPAGTVTYWPTDDFFGDIYAAFLDSVTLPGGLIAAAGQYEILMEVFDGAGTKVAPGAGTFQFIVPSAIESDGETFDARAAQATEIGTAANDVGGFLFKLHIDNNGCAAGIDAPFVNASAPPDPCGFVRYDPLISSAIAQVTVGFHAQHPNNRAIFSFTMVRGITDVAVADASGEVGALTADSYTGDGVGNFSHQFTRTELMGSCANAAFAESLTVAAKVTNGWTRLGGSYDASALRGYALASS